MYFQTTYYRHVAGAENGSGSPPAARSAGSPYPPASHTAGEQTETSQAQPCVSHALPKMYLKSFWSEILLQKKWNTLFRGIQHHVSIVQGIILPFALEKFRSDFLLHRIPDLDTDKELRGQEDRAEEHSTQTKVTYLPVYVLVFDQTSDLAVDHPVKLGNQDNVITIMPVQGKERQPFITSDLAPFTGVEHQLTLIHDQEKRSFLNFLALKILLGELNKVFWCYLYIALVMEKLPSFWRDTF